ncbi:DEAD/DEAH box helicase [Sinomonas sp. ASV486]|uniref:RNA helicase n=1 Tax=Sinomonas puerhi TaxID=3238584 RepID=A0AB39L175_9MICC|nr:DEAD/DEAH box helicase [Sinomonas sp. ASV486]MDQ4491068.1 DEAD/DEAH box helicase [Sinomonas sp. ASV486]
MNEVHTHELLTDDTGTVTVETEETITNDAPVRQESQKTFSDYGVAPAIAQSLADAGILNPFPIQSMTLGVALGGHDIIGQAKTGTGKTLGFGIPALQRAIPADHPDYAKLPAPGAPQALVVVPTRELAVQVSKDLQTASKRTTLRVEVIYGGRAYEPQIEALKRGVEVVVGTPGRLIDLHRQRHLNLKNVRMIVLDEADEMLDLGFLPDVETLMAAVPAVRQTLLFSATMPGPVVAMARRYMTQPTHIRASDPNDDSITKKDIRQVIYRAHQLDKDEVVARILQAEGRGRTIIFTKTKRTAAKLSEELIDRGFAAAALHGDLGQGAREQALRAFRHGKVDVLVATDVAARGIDVEDVTHVINFQCPEDEKAYLHRVGRTGRAGNKGTAVTFVDWEDVPRWTLINKALGLDVPEPVETYSSSPHLYADLDIPAGTKGRLPRNKRVLEGLAGEVVEDLGEPGKKPRRSSEGRGRGERRGESAGQHGSRRSPEGRGDAGHSTARRAQESTADDGAAIADAEVTEGAGKSGHGHGRADRQAHAEPSGEGRRRRRRPATEEASEAASTADSTEEPSRPARTRRKPADTSAERSAESTEQQGRRRPTSAAMAVNLADGGDGAPLDRGVAAARRRRSRTRRRDGEVVSRTEAE